MLRKVKTCFNKKEIATKIVNNSKILKLEKCCNEVRTTFDNHITQNYF